MKSKPKQSSISNLLVQICRLRRNKSNVLLSETGIYAGQDVLLYYLSIEDGQTVSALVEKICIQHATISNMIDRMVIAGMIKKEKDSLDKRTSRIYLTRKGKDSYQQVARVWKEMEATATSGLTQEQKDTLHHLLQLVQKNLS